MYLKANRALIAYNPGTDQIEVGPLLEEGDRDWTAPYRFTCGAAFVNRRTMEGWQSIAMLFIDFHSIVVRDHVPLEAAHAAFLQVEEYRNHISSDIEGAALAFYEETPDA